MGNGTRVWENLAIAKHVEKAQNVPAGQRMLLQAVPWQVYMALRDLPDNYHVRMTYHRGELEMMSPSRLHEQLARFIEYLIRIWAEELNLEISSCGTMTFRREDLQRGLELDDCYYIEREPLVRGKKEIDFSTDPPPDLAIEVSLTSGGLGKLPHYAAFGVPEVWRFDGQYLQVFLLGPDGRYHPSSTSKSLPLLPPAEMERLLRQFGTAGETTLGRSFRDWVRRVVLPELKSGGEGQ